MKRWGLLLLAVFSVFTVKAQSYEYGKLRCSDGDSDPNVPVAGSRDAYRALKAAGADVRYHEFPGCGHVCWWKAFEMPDFMEWMFSKSKRKVQN